MGEIHGGAGRPRVPPGQTVTTKWPVLTHGAIPRFDGATWDFRVVGEVGNPLRLNLGEFQTLPRVRRREDFHCVTTWSRLDNQWEGVSSAEIVARVQPTNRARHVLVHCDGEYTANLALEDFLAPGVLFADVHDGVSLAPEHGWPVRLVVPHLYAWKSAKWVRAVAFLAEEHSGFWELRGYHRRGDPWREERFSGPE